MLKFGLKALTAATLIVSKFEAIELESGLQADIETLLQSEVDAENSRDCNFPNTKQFNTPEYLAMSGSCKKRMIW